MKRILCLLAALGLMLTGTVAFAAEGDPLLSAEELGQLRGSYEAFLSELGDLIVEKGLLDEEQREAWYLYQLGDFFQNGGYGMIAAMYTPDLLEYAREEDALLRLSCETEVGTLYADTMRGYTPLDAAQPGLLLELSLTDAGGLPVPCRFRLSASQGTFIAWDVLRGCNSDVGISLTNDGRPCYWTDQPLTTDAYAEAPVITIEVLSEEDDTQVLATAELTLTPCGTGWRIEDNALR